MRHGPHPGEQRLGGRALKLRRKPADEADLVGHAPERNRGVVEVLLHHLLDLLEQIADRALADLRRVGIVHRGVDEGDLGVDDESHPVGDIVVVLCIRVVRETNCIRANFADQRIVDVLLLRRCAPALVLEVLVCGHAMQRVGLAVEEEAFVRIDPKGADAERKGDAVQQLAVRRTQLDGQRVEIRTGLAIPEVRAANLERLLHLRGAVGRRRCCRVGDGYDPISVVAQRRPDPDRLIGCLGGPDS